MKRALLAIGAAGLVAATLAIGQPFGGPGMMGGYGGPGMGMGPGMMGGYGGPGMGMGPGMMGGYGMGPGMMGGGSGMGPGMMGGFGAGYGSGCNTGGPELSSEQRQQLTTIQSEFAPRQWALMQKMQEAGWRSGGPSAGGSFDEQSARQSYEAMAALRKQMFENSLEARKRVEAILTPEQREQMRRGGAGQ